MPGTWHLAPGNWHPQSMIIIESFTKSKKDLISTKYDVEIGFNRVSASAVCPKRFRTVSSLNRNKEGKTIASTIQREEL